MSTFGRRLLMSGLSLMPGAKERIRLAAVKALAADEARKAGDYRAAADKYHEAYELVAGINDYFPPLYKLGEAFALSDLGEAGDDDALRHSAQLFGELVDDPAVVARRDVWVRAAHGYGCGQLSLGVREGHHKPIHLATLVLQDVRNAMVREKDPVAWAEVQHALGEALYLFGSWSGETDTFRKAVAAFEAALSVRTRKETPSSWAESQYQLALALSALGEADRDAGHFRRAIGAFEASLIVWDRTTIPGKWASARECLGKARLSLGRQMSDKTMIVMGRQEVATACEIYEEIGDTESNSACRESLKEFDVALAQVG